ncbi:DUF4188 domain-containing protein [Streptomonospora alba]|uniref:DUF4188 domain-containing protein n=1 Tax=Streptomonospora alba TaxID=183763 RepID=UPI00069C0F06|nr:DUF4188 domain-containing protein [Streptomonospora alba]
MTAVTDTRIPRLTTEPRDSMTVFLLGARVNALLRPRRWMWVGLAFNRMAAELRADPALGLLHSRSLPSVRGVTVIQYWESTAALLRYAHAETHSEAWRRFYRQGGDEVGLWHETYEIGLPQAEDADRAEDAGADAGKRRGYEAIYANVPPLGLGRALGTRPIGRDTHRALDRLALRRARAQGRANGRGGAKGAPGTAPAPDTPA